MFLYHWVFLRLYSFRVRIKLQLLMNSFITLHAKQKNRKLDLGPVTHFKKHWHEEGNSCQRDEKEKLCYNLVVTNRL